MNDPTTTLDSSTVSDPASSGLYALIEHLYADTCSSPQKIIALASDYDNEITRVFALPCNMWDCPECGERKRQRWLIDVMHGVSCYMQGNGLDFYCLTLTLGGRNRKRDTSISVWRSVWPRLNSRHYRAFGWCPYVLVPEPHKNGVVHLHAILSSPSDERWWKDNCHKSGGGYIASFEPCRDAAHAGGYFTKYIHKQVAITKWPKGFNRVRTSQHWPKLDRPQPGNDFEWKVVRLEQLQWLITYHYGIGMDVRWGWSNLTVDA